MTRAQTIWTTARAWWVPTVALVVVAALVLLTGGLATVDGAQGRAAAPESELRFERWVFVLHGAELVDGSEYDPEDPDRVQVRLRALYTGEETTYGLGPNLVTVQGPAGTAPLDDSPSSEGDRSGNVDPGVAQELTLSFRWPDAPVSSPGTIRVLIRDEKEKDNYITGPELEARAAPSVHVDLPCLDQRAGR